MLYTILMITFWLEHRRVVEKPYVLSLQFYICCFNTMTPDVFILHRCKHWQNRSVLFQKLSLERRSFSSGSCRHRELYARKGFEGYELDMFLEFRLYYIREEVATTQRPSYSYKICQKAISNDKKSKFKLFKLLAPKTEFRKIKRFYFSSQFL